VIISKRTRKLYELGVNIFTILPDARERIVKGGETGEAQLTGLVSYQLHICDVHLY
jgi:hypothetical protein